MTPENLYNEWLNIFLNKGIPFENETDIIHFTNYKVYTPYTYKFTYNFSLLQVTSDDNNYQFSDSDYKLFANLFFTDGWEEELDYQLIYYQDRFKVKKPNENFSDNYGDICWYVKDWVEYVTFQGYRTIIQFRWDKYLISLRKEKLLKLYDR